MTHSWRFFYAGGFNQVCLEEAEDLLALKHLDQKLWATLACPTSRLALNQRMLNYLDPLKTGRIRAPEILACIAWLNEHLASLNSLFDPAPLTLESFSSNAQGEGLKQAARRLQSLLNIEPHAPLTSNLTADLPALFPADKANGDGIITVAFVKDEGLAQLVGEILACVGGKLDRSGEMGVSAEAIESFYAQAQAAAGWQQSLEKPPFDAKASKALAAFAPLRDKIDDYFTRTALLGYDERALALLSVQEAELLRLGSVNLANREELKALPIAKLSTHGALPLTQGVNPAWAQALQELKENALQPLFGDITELTLTQWQALLAEVEPYFAWQSAKPELPVLQCLPIERIEQLVAENRKDALLAKVAEDLAVEQAANSLVDLDKILCLKEDFIRLLRNFVSLQDFYEGKDKAVFQAGRLFIDGKSCDLVVEVGDIAAHAAIAQQSNSFLLYLTCKRQGQPVAGRDSLNLVAVVSAGVNYELMPGRNGLFYDRDGNAWDATVVKVVENAISVRQAFWSPYQRIADLISQQIQKFAQGQDSKLLTNVESKVQSVNANGTTAAQSPFDIARFAGIFAAIGLALGAIGTAIAAVFSGLLALSWWQWPLLVLGIVALVSGPSMLMAWFKLRRRSLGPILDANGWAINTQAKISLLFGSVLTQLASLPKDAKRSLKVRSEETSKAGRKLLLGLLALGAVAAAAWYYLAPKLHGLL